MKCEHHYWRTRRLVISIRNTLYPSPGYNCVGHLSGRYKAMQGGALWVTVTLRCRVPKENLVWIQTFNTIEDLRLGFFGSRNLTT
jgi:hypothetical protein